MLFENGFLKIPVWLPVKISYKLIKVHLNSIYVIYQACQKKQEDYFASEPHHNTLWQSLIKYDRLKEIYFLYQEVV